MLTPDQFDVLAECTRRDVEIACPNCNDPDYVIGRWCVCGYIEESVDGYEDLIHTLDE